MIADQLGHGVLVGECSSCLYEAADLLGHGVLGDEYSGWLHMTEDWTRKALFENRVYEFPC